jgi:hypothetical protein
MPTDARTGILVAQTRPGCNHQELADSLGCPRRRSVVLRYQNWDLLPAVTSVDAKMGIRGHDSAALELLGHAGQAGVGQRHRHVANQIGPETGRRTGSCCSATYTTPKPPSPICSRSLKRPITVPGLSVTVLDINERHWPARIPAGCGKIRSAQFDPDSWKRSTRICRADLILPFDTTRRF